MKLHKDFLIKELDLPDNAIKDTITSTSRWSEHHEIIFEFEGKFYKTHYSQGLTEYQDESPWEYDDEVECIEVELVEKLVKVWVTKNK
jgi:hypothetical protein|nr:MAG TPA: hypothetical protein [Caudoviricetes sp.]